MLELRIEGRSFGQPVLGEIFTTIRHGDRICLLGPSGIGKTTLLNAIAGLDRSMPDTAVPGRDKMRVGYLFQEHRLLPWRTLRQNLGIAGVGNADIERLLASVGLAGYADHLPDQLSLGMARRAALARCLAIQPDLLLLDEPFASLDPVRATELKQLILDLLNRYPTMAMICVTHDARDATELANRLWYLDGQPACLQWDGSVSAQAGVDSLVQRLRTLHQVV